MKKITINELSKIDLTNKIICFPTDTVYGVAARIDDILAVEKIYAIKKRDLDKPLACLAGKIDDIKKIVKVNENHQDIINKWPGALTIIFEKLNQDSYHYISNTNSIAFRIPNSSVALAVVNHFGVMATTSINYSGEKPLNTVKEIEEAFGDVIDYLIVDEFVGSNVSSTVVDATTNQIKVLRQGDIII